MTRGAILILLAGLFILTACGGGGAPPLNLNSCASNPSGSTCILANPAAERSRVLRACLASVASAGHTSDAACAFVPVETRLCLTDPFASQCVTAEVTAIFDRANITITDVRDAACLVSAQGSPADSSCAARINVIDICNDNPFAGSGCRNIANFAAMELTYCTNEQTSWNVGCDNNVHVRTQTARDAACLQRGTAAHPDCADRPALVDACKGNPFSVSGCATVTGGEDMRDTFCRRADNLFNPLCKDIESTIAAQDVFCRAPNAISLQSRCGPIINGICDNNPFERDTAGAFLCRAQAFVDERARLCLDPFKNPNAVNNCGLIVRPCGAVGALSVGEAFNNPACSGVAYEPDRERLCRANLLAHANCPSVIARICERNSFDSLCGPQYSPAREQVCLAADVDIPSGINCTETIRVFCLNPANLFARTRVSSQTGLDDYRCTGAPVVINPGEAAQQPLSFAELRAANCRGTDGAIPNKTYCPSIEAEHCVEGQTRYNEANLFTDTLCDGPAYEPARETVCLDGDELVDGRCMTTIVELCRENPLEQTRGDVVKNRCGTDFHPDQLVLCQNDEKNHGACDEVIELACDGDGESISANPFIRDSNGDALCEGDNSEGVSYAEMREQQCSDMDNNELANTVNCEPVMEETCGAPDELASTKTFSALCSGADYNAAREAACAGGTSDLGDCTDTVARICGSGINAGNYNNAVCSGTDFTTARQDFCADEVRAGKAIPDGCGTESIGLLGGFCARINQAGDSLDQPRVCQANYNTALGVLCAQGSAADVASVNPFDARCDGNQDYINNRASRCAAGGALPNGADATDCTTTARLVCLGGRSGTLNIAANLFHAVCDGDYARAQAMRCNAGDYLASVNARCSDGSVDFCGASVGDNLANAFDAAACGNHSIATMTRDTECRISTSAHDCGDIRATICAGNIFTQASDSTTPNPLNLCNGIDVASGKTYAELRQTQCRENIASAGRHSNATAPLCAREVIAVCGTTSANATVASFTDTLCTTKATYNTARELACAQGGTPPEGVDCTATRDRVCRTEGTPFDAVCSNITYAEQQRDACRDSELGTTPNHASGATESECLRVVENFCGTTVSPTALIANLFDETLCRVAYNPARKSFCTDNQSNAARRECEAIVAAECTDGTGDIFAQTMDGKNLCQDGVIGRSTSYDTMRASFCTASEANADLTQCASIVAGLCATNPFAPTTGGTGELCRDGVTGRTTDYRAARRESCLDAVAGSLPHDSFTLPDESCKTILDTHCKDSNLSSEPRCPGYVDTAYTGAGYTDWQASAGVNSGAAADSDALTNFIRGGTSAGGLNLGIKVARENPLTLTLNDDGFNGFALASADLGGVKLYAGLLTSTTNLGGPISDILGKVTYNGSVQILHLSGGTVAASGKDDFALSVNFSDRSFESSTILSGLGGAYTLELDGNYTQNGFLITAGATARLTDNNSNVSAGVLSGLIGQTGATAVFRSTAAETNAAGEFVGGFLAQRTGAPICDVSDLSVLFTAVCDDNRPAQMARENRCRTNPSEHDCTDTIVKFCGTMANPTPTTKNLFDKALCKDDYIVARREACLNGSVAPSRVDGSCGNIISGYCVGEVLNNEDRCPGTTVSSCNPMLLPFNSLCDNDIRALDARATACRIDPADTRGCTDTISRLCGLNPFEQTTPDTGSPVNLCDSNYNLARETACHLDLVPASNTEGTAKCAETRARVCATEGKPFRALCSGATYKTQQEDACRDSTRGTADHSSEATPTLCRPVVALFCVLDNNGALSATNYRDMLCGGAEYLNARGRYCGGLSPADRASATGCGNEDSSGYLASYCATDAGIGDSTSCPIAFDVACQSAPFGTGCDAIKYHAQQLALCQNDGTSDGTCGTVIATACNGSTAGGVTIAANPFVRDDNGTELCMGNNPQSVSYASLRQAQCRNQAGNPFANAASCVSVIDNFCGVTSAPASANTFDTLCSGAQYNGAREAACDNGTSALGDCTDTVARVCTTPGISANNFDNSVCAGLTAARQKFCVDEKRAGRPLLGGCGDEATGLLGDFCSGKGLGEQLVCENTYNTALGALCAEGSAADVASVNPFDNRCDGNQTYINNRVARCAANVAMPTGTDADDCTATASLICQGGRSGNLNITADLFNSFCDDYYETAQVSACDVPDPSTVSGRCAGITTDFCANGRPLTHVFNAACENDSAAMARREATCTDADEPNPATGRCAATLAGLCGTNPFLQTTGSTVGNRCTGAAYDSARLSACLATPLVDNACRGTDGTNGLIAAYCRDTSNNNANAFAALCVSGTYGDHLALRRTACLNDDNANSLCTEILNTHCRGDTLGTESRCAGYVDTADHGPGYTAWRDDLDAASAGNGSVDSGAASAADAATNFIRGGANSGGLNLGVGIIKGGNALSVTLDDDRVNGFALASANLGGVKLYAGLLTSTTLLGGPINQSAGEARFTGGRLRILNAADEVIQSDDFTLIVDFDGTPSLSARAVVGVYTIVFGGRYNTTNGLITSGTVTITNAGGSSGGLLSGIIGKNGTAGVFRTTGASASNPAGEFVGGFVANRQGCDVSDQAVLFSAVCDNDLAGLTERRNVCLDAGESATSGRCVNMIGTICREDPFAQTTGTVGNRCVDASGSTTFEVARREACLNGSAAPLEVDSSCGGIISDYCVGPILTMEDRCPGATASSCNPTLAPFSGSCNNDIRALAARATACRLDPNDGRDCTATITRLCDANPLERTTPISGSPANLCNASYNGARETACAGGTSPLGDCTDTVARVCTTPGISTGNFDNPVCSNLIDERAAFCAEEVRASRRPAGCGVERDGLLIARFCADKGATEQTVCPDAFAAANNAIARACREDNPFHASCNPTSSTTYYAERLLLCRGVGTFPAGETKAAVCATVTRWACDGYTGSDGTIAANPFIRDSGGNIFCTGNSTPLGMTYAAVRQAQCRAQASNPFADAVSCAPVITDFCGATNAPATANTFNALCGGAEYNTARELACDNGTSALGDCTATVARVCGASNGSEIDGDNYNNAVCFGTGFTEARQDFCADEVRAGKAIPDGCGTESAGLLGGFCMGKLAREEIVCPDAFAAEMGRIATACRDVNPFHASCAPAETTYYSERLAFCRGEGSFPAGVVKDTVCPAVIDLACAGNGLDIAANPFLRDSTNTNLICVDSAQNNYTTERQTACLNDANANSLCTEILNTHCRGATLNTESRCAGYVDTADHALGYTAWAASASVDSGAASDSDAATNFIRGGANSGGLNLGVGIIPEPAERETVSLDDDRVNGFALAAFDFGTVQNPDINLYAGLLTSTTLLGGPISQSSGEARFNNGRLRILNEAGNIEASNNFILTVDFDTTPTPTLTSSTVVGIYTIEFGGRYNTTNGLITNGTVTITNAGDSSGGLLTGIIGKNGTVGVFRTTGASASNPAGEFVGGFVANRDRTAPPPTPDPCVNPTGAPFAVECQGNAQALRARITICTTEASTFTEARCDETTAPGTDAARVRICESTNPFNTNCTGDNYGNATAARQKQCRDTTLYPKAVGNCGAVISGFCGAAGGLEAAQAFDSLCSGGIYTADRQRLCLASPAAHGSCGGTAGIIATFCQDTSGANPLHTGCASRDFDDARAIVCRVSGHGHDGDCDTTITRLCNGNPFVETTGTVALLCDQSYEPARLARCFSSSAPDTEIHSSCSSKIAIYCKLPNTSDERCPGGTTVTESCENPTGAPFAPGCENDLRAAAARETMCLATPTVNDLCGGTGGLIAIYCGDTTRNNNTNPFHAECRKDDYGNFDGARIEACLTNSDADNDCGRIGGLLNNHCRGANLRSEPRCQGYVAAADLAPGYTAWAAGADVASGEASDSDLAVNFIRGGAIAGKLNLGVGITPENPLEISLNDDGLGGNDGVNGFALASADLGGVKLYAGLLTSTSALGGPISAQSGTLIYNGEMHTLTNPPTGPVVARADDDFTLTLTLGTGDTSTFTSMTTVTANGATDQIVELNGGYDSSTGLITSGTVAIGSAQGTLSGLIGEFATVGVFKATSGFVGSVVGGIAANRVRCDVGDDSAVFGTPCDNERSALARRDDICRTEGRTERCMAIYTTLCEANPFEKILEAGVKTTRPLCTGTSSNPNQSYRVVRRNACLDGSTNPEAVDSSCQELIDGYCTNITSNGRANPFHPGCGLPAYNTHRAEICRLSDEAVKVRCTDTVARLCGINPFEQTTAVLGISENLCGTNYDDAREAACAGGTSNLGDCTATVNRICNPITTGNYRNPVCAALHNERTEFCANELRQSRGTPVGCQGLIAQFCVGKGASEPLVCPDALAAANNAIALACRDTNPFAVSCAPSTTTYHSQRLARCLNLDNDLPSGVDRDIDCMAVITLACDGNSADITPNWFIQDSADMFVCKDDNMTYTAFRLGQCIANPNRHSSCGGANGIIATFCKDTTSNNGANPLNPVCAAPVYNTARATVCSVAEHGHGMACDATITRLCTDNPFTRQRDVMGVALSANLCTGASADASKTYAAVRRDACLAGSANPDAVDTSCPQIIVEYCTSHRADAVNNIFLDFCTTHFTQPADLARVFAARATACFAHEGADLPTGCQNRSQNPRGFEICEQNPFAHPNCAGFDDASIAAGERYDYDSAVANYCALGANAHLAGCPPAPVEAGISGAGYTAWVMGARSDDGTRELGIPILPNVGLNDGRVSLLQVGDDGLTFSDFNNIGNTLRLDSAIPPALIVAGYPNSGVSYGGAKDFAGKPFYYTGLLSGTTTLGGTIDTGAVTAREQTSASWTISRFGLFFNGIEFTATDLTLTVDYRLSTITLGQTTLTVDPAIKPKPAGVHNIAIMGSYSAKGIIYGRLTFARDVNAIRPGPYSGVLTGIIGRGGLAAVFVNHHNVGDDNHFAGGFVATPNLGAVAINSPWYKASDVRDAGIFVNSSNAVGAHFIHGTSAGLGLAGEMGLHLNSFKNVYRTHNALAFGSAIPRGADKARQYYAGLLVFADVGDASFAVETRASASWRARASILTHANAGDFTDEDFLLHVDFANTKIFAKNVGEEGMDGRGSTRAVFSGGQFLTFNGAWDETTGIISGTVKFGTMAGANPTSGDLSGLIGTGGALGVFKSVAATSADNVFVGGFIAERAALPANFAGWQSSFAVGAANAGLDLLGAGAFLISFAPIAQGAPPFIPPPPPPLGSPVGDVMGTVGEASVDFANVADWEARLALTGEQAPDGFGPDEGFSLLPAFLTTATGPDARFIRSWYFTPSTTNPAVIRVAGTRIGLTYREALDYNLDNSRLLSLRSFAGRGRLNNGVLLGTKTVNTHVQYYATLLRDTDLGVPPLIDDTLDEAAAIVNWQVWINILGNDENINLTNNQLFLQLNFKTGEIFSRSDDTTTPVSGAALDSGGNDNDVTFFASNTARPNRTLTFNDARWDAAGVITGLVSLLYTPTSGGSKRLHGALAGVLGADSAVAAFTLNDKVPGFADNNVYAVGGFVAFPTGPVSPPPASVGDFDAWRNDSNLWQEQFAITNDGGRDSTLYLRAQGDFINQEREAAGYLIRGTNTGLGLAEHNFSDDTDTSKPDGELRMYVNVFANSVADTTGTDNFVAIGRKSFTRPFEMGDTCPTSDPCTTVSFPQFYAGLPTTVDVGAPLTADSPFIINPDLQVWDARISVIDTTGRFSLTNASFKLQPRFGTEPGVGELVVRASGGLFAPLEYRFQSPDGMEVIDRSQGVAGFSLRWSHESGVVSGLMVIRDKSSNTSQVFLTGLIGQKGLVGVFAGNGRVLSTFTPFSGVGAIIAAPPQEPQPRQAHFAGWNRVTVRAKDAGGFSLFIEDEDRARVPIDADGFVTIAPVSHTFFIRDIPSTGLALTTRDFTSGNGYELDEGKLTMNLNAFAEIDDSDTKNALTLGWKDPTSRRECDRDTFASERDCFFNEDTDNVRQYYAGILNTADLGIAPARDLNKLFVNWSARFSALGQSVQVINQPFFIQLNFADREIFARPDNTSVAADNQTRAGFTSTHPNSDRVQMHFESVNWDLDGVISGTVRLEFFKDDVSIDRGAPLLQGAYRMEIRGLIGQSSAMGVIKSENRFVQHRTGSLAGSLANGVSYNRRAVGGFIATRSAIPQRPGTFTAWEENFDFLAQSRRDAGDFVSAEDAVANAAYFIEGGETALGLAQDNEALLSLGGTDTNMAAVGWESLALPCPQDDMDCVPGSLGNVHQYYGGLLSGAVVGAPIATDPTADEATAFVNWLAQLVIYAEPARVGGQFPIRHDFNLQLNMKTGGIFAQGYGDYTRVTDATAPVSIDDTRSFYINGLWGGESGLISGVVSFTSSGNTDVANLTGILGVDGALGVFATDATRAPTIAPTRVYVGGFSAASLLPIAGARSAWLHSFSTGELNAALGPVRTENNYVSNTEATAVAAHFIRGDVDSLPGGDTKLTLTDTRDGISLGRDIPSGTGGDGQLQLYAGMLNQTNVGEVLPVGSIAPARFATWRARASIVAQNGGFVDQNFFLQVDFENRRIASRSEVAGSAGNSIATSFDTFVAAPAIASFSNGTNDLTLQGIWNARGVLNGDIRFFFTGGGEDSSQTYVVRGALTGLIGLDGAVGVFKNYDGLRDNYLVGGFVAESNLVGSHFIAGDADGIGLPDADQTSLDLSQYGGAATNGLAFGNKDINSVPQYYAGLFSGADVGRPLDLESSNLYLNWTGRLGFLSQDLTAQDITDGVNDQDIALQVNFYRRTLAIAGADFNEEADADTALRFGTRSFALQGRWDENGIISGEVQLAQTDETTNNGRVTGLIGEGGALGVFKSNDGVLSHFVGGFIAAPDVPGLASYTSWAGSFGRGGANVAHTLRGFGVFVNTASAVDTHFMAAGEGAGLGLSDEITLDMGIFPSIEDGGRNGVSLGIGAARAVCALQGEPNYDASCNPSDLNAIPQYYASLLGSTDLGAPFKPSTGFANWHGRVSLRAAAGGFTEQAFFLQVNLAERTVRSRRTNTSTALDSAENIFGADTQRFLLDGEWNSNGVISGTAEFRSSEEATDAVPSAGVLAGLIGQGGAVGVFKNVAGAANPYIGGFVATRDIVDFRAWHSGVQNVLEAGAFLADAEAAGTHFIQGLAAGLDTVSSAGLPNNITRQVPLNLNVLAGVSDSNNGIALGVHAPTRAGVDVTECTTQDTTVIPDCQIAQPTKYYGGLLAGANVGLPFPQESGKAFANWPARVHVLSDNGTVMDGDIITDSGANRSDDFVNQDFYIQVNFDGRTIIARPNDDRTPATAATRSGSDITSLGVGVSLANMGGGDSMKVLFMEGDWDDNGVISGAVRFVETPPDIGNPAGPPNGTVNGLIGDLGALGVFKGMFETEDAMQNTVMSPYVGGFVAAPSQ